MPMVVMEVVLDRVPEAIDAGIALADEAHNEGIQTLAENARMLVPVATGELQDSIQETSEGVEAGTDHAFYVEFGTYKMSAQPFMSPSVPVALEAMQARLQAG